MYCIIYNLFYLHSEKEIYSRVNYFFIAIKCVPQTKKQVGNFALFWRHHQMSTSFSCRFTVGVYCPIYIKGNLFWHLTVIHSTKRISNAGNVTEKIEATPYTDNIKVISIMNNGYFKTIFLSGYRCYLWY